MFSLNFENFIYTFSDKYENGDRISRKTLSKELQISTEHDLLRHLKSLAIEGFRNAKFYQVVSITGKHAIEANLNSFGDNVYILYRGRLNDEGVVEMIRNPAFRMFHTVPENEMPHYEGIEWMLSANTKHRY